MFAERTNQSTILGVVEHGQDIANVQSGSVQAVRVVVHSRFAPGPRDGARFFRQDDNGSWSPVSRRDEEEILESIRGEGIDLDHYLKGIADFASKDWLVEATKPLKTDTSYLLEMASGAKSIFASEPTTESIQIVSVEAFSSFEIIGLECIDSEGAFKKYFIDEPKRESKQLHGCDPERGITLLFSGPAISSGVRSGTSITPEIPISDRTVHVQSRFTVFPFQFGRRDGLVFVSQFSRFGGRSLLFAEEDNFNKIWLGYRLNGNTTYTLHIGSSPIKDVFGRQLRNPMEIEFRTGHLKPRLIARYPLAVMNANAGADLPVEVANLRNLNLRLFSQQKTEARWSLEEKRQRLSVVVDQTIPTTLDFSDLLLERSAPFVAVVEPTAIRRYGEDPDSSCIVGQLTSYNVWARIGYSSSIVWLTDLETGEVVPNVPVSLVSLSGSLQTPHAHVSTDSQGIAKLPGRIELPTVADAEKRQLRADEFKDEDCLGFFDSEYSLRIEESEGFSVLPLNGYTHVDDWGYGWAKDLHLSVWGHTAQGIYRPGQDIQYKIYVREQVDDGLRLIKDTRFHLLAYGRGEELIYHENGIELNDVGAFAGEFKIPKSFAGKLNFVLVVDKGEEIQAIWDTERRYLRFGYERWHAFDIEVLDFDPATIRGVTNKLNQDVYERGDKLLVHSKSELISGSPYGDAPVSIEASLRGKRFFSQHPQTKKFTFPSSSGWRPSWELDNFQTDGNRTDSRGEFEASLNLDANRVLFGTLTVSLGVQEDSGEIIWDFKRVEYRGSNRFVGIYHSGSIEEVGKALSVEAIVVGPDGEPKNDLPIMLQYFRVTAESSYGPESRTLVHSCELAVNDEPKSCALIPEHPGLYQAVAAINTSDQGTQEAIRRIYVSGQTHVQKSEQREYVRFSNKSELESREFRSGEIASLVLEHSFPGSMALITIERLGILQHWVTELRGPLEVIDIPIQQKFAPTVRASVTLTTVNSKEKPRALVTSVDRTAFPNSWTRSVELRVANSIEPLKLEISTDNEVYEPGDRVKVKVEALDDASSPIELAVAVVDQGVLEMSRKGMKHYDPLLGFFAERDIDVESHWMLSDEWNYSYARVEDSAPFDEPNPRSNQDLTSLWLPIVEVDGDGNASFEFEVGDRLTEWRIIVVAATPSDRFGFSETAIRTNRAIEIRPVLPNLVTDGDIFDASFSILNRSDSNREVSVEIVVAGDVEPYSHAELIALDPFERKLVSAPTKAELQDGNETSVGSIRLLASASSDEFLDSLEQHVPVHRSTAYFVSSIYGTSTEEVVSERVEIPFDIKEGTGSLSIHATPTLINATEERIAQVRDYPYQCWEQKLSSAVVAAQYSRLKERMNVSWKGANNFIRDILQSAVDFQANSGGFGYWSGQPENTDPYLSAYTALAFSWLSDAGHEIPPTVLSELLGYLENQGLYLLPDHLRWDKTAGSSLVLTVANALVQHQQGNWKLVSRLYEESTNANLFAIAQTLEAAVQLDISEDKLAPMATRLTNAIGIQGDRALIHHDSVARRNYTLSSTLKTTCSAVSAFVRASRAGKQLVSEEKIAALVRGIVFEWNLQKYRTNPHESAFCLSAVIEYVENFETDTDDIEVEVDLVMDESVGQIQFERHNNLLPNDHSSMFSLGLGPILFGKPAELFLRKTGNSRFYYKTTLQYESSEIQTERENLGIDVSKAYWVKNGDRWEELNNSHLLQMGDVVHVGLYLDIRDQRDFVIVDDPVPGFLKPINFRLAKTNVREVRPTLDLFGKLVPGDIQEDWNILGSSRWGFYNRQIRNENVRFASDFLPSGRYRLYWSGRVISTGEFNARPAHAEAMYSPEIYGNSRPRRITTVAK